MRAVDREQTFLTIVSVLEAPTNLIGGHEPASRLYQLSHRIIPFAAQLVAAFSIAPSPTGVTAFR